MLRLCVLGQLALTRDGAAVGTAGVLRRSLLLLAVLAVAGRRGVRKDELLLYFWGDSDLEHARNSLRQTMFRLRRDLACPELVEGQAELRLNPAVIDSDVAEFEFAVATGALERAAELYTGPLLRNVQLPGAPEFEHWIAQERTRLCERGLDVFTRLAQAAAERGDHGTAVAWWRRAAGENPANARTALGILEGLRGQGDLAGVLQHARAYETRLREEWGLAPDERVTALVEAVRRGAPKEAGPAGARGGAPVHAAPDRPTAPWPGDHGQEAAGNGTASRTAPDVGAPDVGAPDVGEPNGGAPDVGARDGGAPPDVGARDGRRPSGGAAAGVRPSKPSEPTRRRRAPAMGLLLLLTAGLLAATALLTVRSDDASVTRAGDDLTVESTLVVVAPFDVFDAHLDLWAEGMADVLALNLDGAGPLRTVSSASALRRWAELGDTATWHALGRATGAGIVISGALIASGPDSVRATMTILDVRTNRVVDRVQVQEAEPHMARLTDTLTLVALRAIGEQVPVTASRHSTYRLPSNLGALLTFLRAEQFYRRAQWDSARAYYGRVIEQDSVFALPYRRIGNVLAWERMVADPASDQFLLRAGALNRGLGPRDSLLVAADSMGAAAGTTENPLLRWMLTRRLFRTLDEAAARYPRDPEVWFAIGEARYHRGLGAGLSVPEREQLAAFERAIELDPAFAPAYIHTTELALNTLDAERALGFAGAYLAVAATEPAHRGVRLVWHILRADATGRGGATTLPAAVRRMLDTASTEALVSARTTLRRYPDRAEAAVYLSRLLAVGRPSVYPTFSDTVRMRRRLAEELAFRGHLTEAGKVLVDRDVPLFAELAYLGGVPRDQARQVFGGWLRSGSPRLRFALPWWATVGDTASITAVIRSRSAALQRSTTVDAATAARVTVVRGADLTGGDAGGEAADVAWARYDVASAEAHLALALGDSGTALARFVQLPDSLCLECYADRLTRTRLLNAQRRHREALARSAEVPFEFLTALEVPMAIERARAAAALGDRQTASQAVDWATRAWQQADPVLRPLLESVRLRR